MSDSQTPVWKLTQLEETGSTNDHAGKLPGWNAVTAKRQTAGRGRYRRSWVSDEGGIWLSASIPTPGESRKWSILPLAAGWAIKEALATLGVTGMHLRWPNDLMVGKTKLVGILVERFAPETAVIGAGINFTNDPASIQPELRGMTTRLSDLLDPLPSRETVISTVLAYYAIAQRTLENGRIAELLPSINAAWRIDKVTLTLNPDSRKVTGAFLGVDEEGRLLVRGENGRQLALLPTDVELLREIG